MIINHCVKCGTKIINNQTPIDKPSARIVCENCVWRNAIEAEAAIYHSQITTDEPEPPLLVIEVKDMHAVPVVRYKGKEIEGRILVDYTWGTKDHESRIHAINLEYCDKDNLTIHRIGLEKLC